MTVFSKIHSSINIILIRNMNNKKKDDSIRILPTSTEGVVNLRYQDSVNESNHELRLTNDELCHYFVSLFHVMSYDTDPFDSIQVNCPAFPCILLSVKDLGYESLRLRLQSMIQLTLKTSFAKMDDDDEDDDDDDEDEYDDMPPLEGYNKSRKNENECECECECY
jgi:hypothetical protein